MAVGDSRECALYERKTLLMALMKGVQKTAPRAVANSNLTRKVLDDSTFT